MFSGLPLIADIDGFSDVRDREQNIDALKSDKKVIRSRTLFGIKVERSPRTGQDEKRFQCVCPVKTQCADCSRTTTRAVRSVSIFLDQPGGKRSPRFT